MSKRVWIEVPTHAGWWWFLNESIGEPVPVRIDWLHSAFANGRRVLAAPHLRWHAIDVPAPRKRKAKVK